jgi:membrane protease YdiL (CAAX protease family)
MFPDQGDSNGSRVPLAPGNSGAPTPPAGYERVAPVSAVVEPSSIEDGMPDVEQCSEMTRDEAPTFNEGRDTLPTQVPVHDSRARRFVKWTLAMACVFVLYLALQLVIAAIGGTVIVSVGMVLSGDLEMALDDTFVDNGLNLVLVASQLIAVAVFLPWWRHMRPGSFGKRRAAVAPKDASIAKTAVALLAVGIASQFVVSGILSLAELAFPEMMAEYAELMEDTSTGVFALVTLLSTVVLAPVNEEIVCRGVMLEYAMRAVAPSWNSRDRAREVAVSARAFWIANMMQALAFGVLHMNIVQGSYAFALGVLQGWVFWRTGKLGYAMLLHFALNASSYLVEPLAPTLNALPPLAVFVFFAAMLVAGIVVFKRAWHVSDALDEVPALQDPAEPLRLGDEAPRSL